MIEKTLEQALELAEGAEGLTAIVGGGFSNGPRGRPPEAGAPFGGLMAALAAGAMRQGLGLKAPLRTLTVQFMAAARFDQAVTFLPRLARGGRSVAFTALGAVQGERGILQSVATWGRDSETVQLRPLAAPPPPLASLDPTRTLHGPMAPHFTQHVEIVFDGGPNILGGNEGRPAVERLWMRARDGRPLDDLRLCFLFDALYPPAWTAFRRPPMMTSVDLRYDLITDPTPELCPDGWAFFEFRMLDIDGGWTVDDCLCWGADGSPIGAARQRRKLL